jgi:hypothetical protein
MWKLPVVMTETPEADMVRRQYRQHPEVYDDGGIAGVEIRCWSKTNELYEGFTFGRDAWG